MTIVVVRLSRAALKKKVSSDTPHSSFTFLSAGAELPELTAAASGLNPPCCEHNTGGGHGPMGVWRKSTEGMVLLLTGATRAPKPDVPGCGVVLPSPRSIGVELCCARWQVPRVCGLCGLVTSPGHTWGVKPGQAP